HLYGTGSTGVILAHMYPADQSDWTDFAQVLAAHGYQALTFDFRGFTESEGSSGTEYAGTDLLAAYQFMRTRASRIYLAGASLGAEAAILVGAREDVAGLILISVPTSFGGIVVTDSIRHVRAPILFVTSAADPLVGGQPEILYREAVAPKSIKVYPGRAHGTAILFGPYGADLQALMLRFIADHQAKN
ncbi:MAG: alpha/beta fold hydrolase, partial [Candidatus Binatus sp.]